MPSISFELIGGETFLMDLTRWRETCQADIAQAAIDEAEALQAEVEQRYPPAQEHTTGNLRAGVTVDRRPGADVFFARVRSRAHHAWLYDNGSATRQTKKGANRGAMPANPTFVPAAIRHRAVFLERAQAILDRVVNI